jgi:ubiquinone/menaquinone biosynthesis C-methylase UbiE
MTEQSSNNPAEIYDQYFVPAIFVPWTRVLLEHAAPNASEHVLDVACGTGVVARSIAPLIGPEGKVVALDVSSDMLAVARALPAPAGAVIEWREGDALALPDGPFDLVLCQQGLQFFPDPAAAVREMRRVLDIGGRVILSVWQPLQLHVVYEALFQSTAHHLDATVADLAHAWSLGDVEKLRELFDGAGFQGLEIKQESVVVQFPSPDRFVELTVLGGATTIPAFAELSEAERAALVESVKEETEDVLKEYRDEQTVAFPMFAHTVVARA